MRTTDPTFYDRHVICLGSTSLVKTFNKRGIKVHAWLDTTGGLLPDDLYLACRALEEKANGSGNNSDSVQLQMAVRRQGGGRLGGHIHAKRLEAEVREMQEESGGDNAIPPFVPCPSVRQSVNENGDKGKHKENNETVGRSDVQVRDGN